MEEKRPRGRPPVSKPRDVLRSIRMDADEDALVRSAAGLDGVNVTVWIREQAVAAAKRRIRRAEG